ncbi:MAG: SDR family oxidoreductase [Candidatus Promineifilaceae bacterium]|jgi:nucleoside-diphosphate-sugar epimerase
MKVLFIGGTGVISTACTKLAASRGIDLYLLNRGQTEQELPPGVTNLIGDINDPNIGEVLSGHHWDAVVNWIIFSPDEVQRDIELFTGRTRQYIFISSASVYQTPPACLPVKESTMLDNPYWEYSRKKIACEERLVEAYRSDKFPMTIVRPSHTYNPSKLPILGGYTALQRMREGRKILVFSDGTSLWTLTHSKDFAKGFVPLLGNSRAVGDTFHITSDEWLNWNQIYELLGQALGVTPQLVHVPSALIAAYDAEIGAGLLGDKSNSMIFDNSKIKRLVPDFSCTIPFSQGAREIVDWYMADETRQVVDEDLDALMDKIIVAQESLYPGD